MHSTVLCRVAVCTMRPFPLVLTLASTVLQTLWRSPLHSCVSSHCPSWLHVNQWPSQDVIAVRHPLITLHLCCLQALSLGGPMALGAISVPFNQPSSLRIAENISKATSIPTDVVHKAVSDAMQNEAPQAQG